MSEITIKTTYTIIVESADIPKTYTIDNIYPDDSIGIIKLKILNLLRGDSILSPPTGINGGKGGVLSPEEMYLFIKKERKINVSELFNCLTQTSSKKEIKKSILKKYLKNISSPQFNLVEPEKETYSYEDIIELELNDINVIINEELGQNSENLIVVNPKLYDEKQPHPLRPLAENKENETLLELFPILDNTIYVFMVEDFFNKDKNKDYHHFTKIYFPFLFNLGITTYKQLIDNRNRNSNNISIDNYLKTIDMFYGVYNNRLYDIKYNAKGINDITVLIKPIINIKLPLETVFKLIHSTKKYPLVKYNPSPKQDNIYRLYADKTSVDGRKIPFLNKASIMKLKLDIGRRTSVSIYLNTLTSIYIVCEFDNCGYIKIISKFEKGIVKDDSVTRL